MAIALVSPVLYARCPGVLPGAVLQGLRQLRISPHRGHVVFSGDVPVRGGGVYPPQPPFPGSPLAAHFTCLCPVVVRLIAFQFPSLLPHILPVLRPVALMAREVRELHHSRIPGARDKEVVLYYINPCPTKSEAGPDRGRKRSTHAGKSLSGSMTFTPI